MNEAQSDADGDIQANRKPIGGNEADFEAVLIDGILGFSLSIGNAILLLVGSISHAQSIFQAATMLVASAVVAALFFKIVQLKTDVISANLPRVVYVCGHALCSWSRS